MTDMTSPPIDNLDKKDSVDKLIKDLPEKDVRLFLQRVAEIFYWDSDADRWDFNKNWDGAADFLDMINEQLPATVTEEIERITKERDA